MSYTPIPKEEIWRISDVVRTIVTDGLEKHPEVSVEQLETMLGTLKDHVIELRMRPPDPSVGRKKGATKPQMELWEQFFVKKDKQIMCAIGANQCLAPDAIVDSPDGFIRVKDIVGSHRVYAWNGKEAVVANAGKPFIKSEEECYRIHLSNGRTLECSGQHLVLLASGEYAPVQELLKDAACLQGCISLCDQLEPYPQNASSCELIENQEVQDFLPDYHPSRRFYGEQPRFYQAFSQDVLPSQGDAQECSRSILSLDDLVATEEHSRLCRSFDRHQIHIEGASEIDSRSSLSHASSSGDRRFWNHKSEVPRLDGWTSSESQSNDASGQSGMLHDAVLGQALMAPYGLSVFIVAYESIGVKPIYDFEVPIYENYLAGGIFNHNSSKSDGIGVCFCKFLRDEAKNGDVFWVVAQSYSTLKDVPLKILYEFLPESMFPDGKKKYDPSVHEVPTLVLTLPGNRGTCEIWFRSEDQGLIKFESARLRGVWWTECASQAIYEALMPRLLAKGGFMLCDLVPFYGWHRTMLRERAAQPNSPIYYRKFVVMDNVHNLAEGAIPRMKATMSDRMWEIRGLGKEAAAQGVVYQNFDPDKHCVAPFKIPEWWPLYMAADWGFNAPHCFGLATVSPNETIFVIAEHYEAQMSVPQTVQAVWEMVNLVRPLRLYPGCGSSVEMFDKLRDIEFKRKANEMNFDDPMAEDGPINPIRDHVRSEFDRVLASPCSIDNQVFQRHGGSVTLAQEFNLTGLPIRPANKRSIDATVEIVRRMFDADRLKFFNTCYKIREDHVTWSYKSGPDMTVADVDKYERSSSHGCDFCRYLILMNPKHNNSVEDAA